MPRLLSPLRHFLGIFLPLAGLVLAVALVWQSQERRLHLDGLRRAEQTRVVQEARIMETVLASRAVDAAFLADRLGHELTRHPREALEEIRDILWTFAFLKRGYAQVRFLGVSGREQVRLVNSVSGPEFLGGGGLRDRSNETAFRKAAAIPFGQVHASRLELEEENGRVLEPLRPVIHFASPVLGPDYSLGGVLSWTWTASCPWPGCASSAARTAPGSCSSIPRATGSWAPARRRSGASSSPSAATAPWARSGPAPGTSSAAATRASSRMAARCTPTPRPGPTPRRA